MKKRIKTLILIIICILTATLLIFILNLKVSYNQGINYRVKTVEIPLYLKVIDLFYRHLHYRELTREIIRNYKTEEEKVFALFNWTRENIKNIPPGLPVIDDHVWSIIVRGYGVCDQYSDVFTTLCNYAGVKAFFTFVKSCDLKSQMPLSFVKIRKQWYVFDPYRGIYFQDNRGKLTSLDMLKKGIYFLAGDTREVNAPYYSEYICNLPAADDVGLTRANIQSPINRLLFELSKLKNKVLK